MSIHIFSSNFDAEQYLQQSLQRLKPFGLSALRKKNVIVVPTKALAEHIRRRCYLWRLSMGFQVLTIAEFAAWILTKKGIEPPKVSPLFSYLLRKQSRLLSEETFVKYAVELAENDEGLDGLVGIELAVSELFKSGFERQRSDRYLENMDPEDLKMIRPIVRIASLLMEERERLGLLGNQEDLYWKAIEELNRDGLPEDIENVFVYGFQDTTAIVASFLRSVYGQLGERNCQIFLHKTLDPIDISKRSLDSSNQIVDEFLSDRLGIQDRPHNHPIERTGVSSIRYVKASGSQAELRNAIQSVAKAVEKGAAWEDCAIVARDLSSYAPFLHSESQKIGVPISLETPVYVSTPSTKRIQALLRLFQQQERCDVYQLLNIFSIQQHSEECVYTVSDVQRYVREENCRTVADLITALEESIQKIEGATQHLSELESASNAGHYLRIVNRISERGAEGRAVTRRKRRYLPLSFLRALHRRLRAVSSQLSLLVSCGTMAEQQEIILELLDRSLEWQSEWNTERLMVCAALQRLEKQLPPVEIGWFERKALLVQEFRDLGKTVVAKKGSGVRILSATDAAGMTFSHLVILGVNRDVFPQQTTEDPILNRTISRQLRAQLPGFTLRERKYIVERHLLHWLIGSAKQVVVSWLLVDDKGKEMAEAPLIRRLLSSQKSQQVKHVPSCLSLRQDREQAPLVDQICLMGIRGDRRYFSNLEAILGWSVGALQEQGRIFSGHLSALADAIEKSLQLRNSESAEFSVYDGIVGRSITYPYLETDLFVTRVEDVLHCPWRSFLVKVLGVSDRNHMMQYPQVQSSDIGTIVHGVLEDIVQQFFTAEEQTIIDVETRLQKVRPRTILWPDADSLERLVLNRIIPQLEEAGIHFAGYRELLQQEVYDLLQTCRVKEFLQDQLRGCLGAEVDGYARFAVQHAFDSEVMNISISQSEPYADVEKLAAGERGIVQCRFKADRIDIREEEGGQRVLSLVDYKTGRPIDTKKKKETNDKKMRALLRQGKKLQIPIYTSCYQGTKKPYPAQGSLFFLQPDIPQHVFSINSEELHEQSEGGSSIAEDTGKILTTALAARTLGTLFPMIEGGGCSWCQLREACHYRDDTFSRKWKSVREKRYEEVDTMTEKIIQSIFQIREDV